MRTRFLLSTAAAILALGVTSGRLSAQGATSICKDGTTSATTGKGACSGHGGVDKKATADAKKAATSSKAASKAATTAPTTAASTTPPATAASKSAAAKTAPTTAPTTATKTASTSKSASEKDSTGAVAQCKDGTYSHQATHRGACSRHGGVAKFLKP